MERFVCVMCCKVDMLVLDVYLMTFWVAIQLAMELVRPLVMQEFFLCAWGLPMHTCHLSLRSLSLFLGDCGLLLRACATYCLSVFRVVSLLIVQFML